MEQTTPWKGYGHKPDKTAPAGTFRSGKAAQEKTGVPADGHAASRREKTGQPAGYEDPVIWAVAEEFLNQARKHDVSVAFGIPYLYKMFGPGLAATGLLSGKKPLDGKRIRIDPADAGSRLVRYFWDKDLWAYDCATGEQVAYRFSEPVNMREWYVSLQQYWERKRAHTFGTLKRAPEVRRNPAAPRRTV